MCFLTFSKANPAGASALRTLVLNVFPGLCDPGYQKIYNNIILYGGML